MQDIWIQELDSDSTTQECDQESTNKGENDEEELAKWESWLKWIGLTCPEETENLKNPSFVYIWYVTEQICTQDTQQLPVNHRPTMAGQQREVDRFSRTATQQHCNFWSIGNMGLDNEKGCYKKQVRKYHCTLRLEENRLGIIKVNFHNSWMKAGCSVLSYKRKNYIHFTWENYHEMGQSCVSWLSYSVVLQCCLLSPNQCEIVKFHERANELCDPCTVFCFIYWLNNTALLEDCINKQYKCVLLLLYPKPYPYILYHV